MGLVNAFGAIALDTSVQSIVAAVKAEDDPHVSTDKGIHALAVRQDADATLTSANNDYASLFVDEEGRLKVAIKTASFPVVTGSLTTAGIVAANIVACDVSRAGSVSFHIVNTGTVTMAAGVFVFEISLDSTDGVNGTWQSAQCKRNNSATVDTSTTITALTAATGVGNHWKISVDGAAWFRVRCSTAPTASAIAFVTLRRTFGTGEILPASSLQGTQSVAGAAAHAGALSGNPVRLGARAMTADYTAVTAGTAADLKCTTAGALVTYDNATPENSWRYAAASGGLTNATALAVKTAAAAGVRNYVKTAQFRNAGATQTEVMILDGATVMWRSQIVAGTADGINVTFDPPLQGTAATAVNVQCSAASTVYCNLQGFTAY